MLTAMHLALVILATLTIAMVPYGQAGPSFIGTFLDLHGVSADQDPVGMYNILFTASIFFPSNSVFLLHLNSLALLLQKCAKEVAQDTTVQLPYAMHTYR